MKRRLGGFLGGLMVVLAWSSPAIQPPAYYFSGQITGKRAHASVFNGDIGDQFSGYFSYDPAAAAIYPGFYPLPGFSIDGKCLNFVNGTDIPFLPGVVVQAPLRPGIGLEFLEIRGFDLAADRA